MTKTRPATTNYFLFRIAALAFGASFGLGAPQAAWAQESTATAEAEAGSDDMDDSGEEGDGGTGYAVQTQGCSLDIGWASMSDGSSSEKPGAPQLSPWTELPACELQWDGEDLLYICQCADNGTQHAGAIEWDAADGRPQLGSICSEKFKDHCGTIKERVERDCSNTAGECQLLASGLVGELSSSRIEVGCQCASGRRWSYSDSGAKAPDYDEATLSNICEQELSQCSGDSATGLGNLYEIPVDEHYVSSAQCERDNAGCRITYNSRKKLDVECECEDKFEIRSKEGFGLPDIESTALLGQCEAWVNECEEMLESGTGPQGLWTVKEFKDEDDEGEEGSDDEDKWSGDGGDQDKGDDPSTDSGAIEAWFEAMGCQVGGTQGAPLSALMLAMLWVIRRRRA